MVERSAPSAGDSQTFGPDTAARARGDAVAVLERLLASLFPGSPSLDCITIDDILRRYRLTGLGAPAMAAIEQSRRIVRARGDYAQAGVGEFHIGLIYFHWEDYRAAAGQFAMARQPWSLAGDLSANCLTHFAQGLALYHAYHNEPAMLQFARAERLLGRPALGAGAARHTALAETLGPLLSAAQEALREHLWPEDRPPEPARSHYLTVPPLRPPTPPPAGQPQPSPEATGQSEARRVFERAPRPPERSVRAARPISNLPGGLGDLPRGPVPGHIVVDDRLGWYIVAERRGSFLPVVTSGTWLLVDNEPDERRPPAGRDFVIVGSHREGAGSISAHPISHSITMPYCYLGYRTMTADGTFQFLLDDSRQPVADGELLVLAVIEGFWYAPDGHLAAAGSEVGG